MYSFRKIKRNDARILQRKRKSVVTTYNCLKVGIKLTDAQLKKLKTAVKNKTGTKLRTNLKILDGNDLSHELLTTRQNTELRNAFNNSMSTDLKLSKGQIYKII